VSRLDACPVSGIDDAWEKVVTKEARCRILIDMKA
jgi:hypothetical protein